MRLRYVYSATVVIETDDLSVCCDPWLTEGIYDGSWWHYPPVPDDPSTIGPVDAIWISHIHPDHYDQRYLRRHLEAFPQTRLLIGRTDPPHLEHKMRVDGFVPEVIDDLTVGGTVLSVIPNQAYGVADIDTALVVSDGEHSVVNMNDNPFDDAQVAEVLARCPGGRPTVALLPYTGAGPFPQTYDLGSVEATREAAERKRRQFFELYRRYLDALDPEVAIPFAGQYVLAGPLAELNELRGVADAVEAIDLDPRTVVLEEGATLDVATGSATAAREERFDPVAVRAYLDGLRFPGFDFEREVRPIDGRALPIVPVLRAAAAAAGRRAPTVDPYWFALRVDDAGPWMVVDATGQEPMAVRESVEELTPRHEISIDGRYLFGLLTRMYHWNNAEVGSMYRSRRMPEGYRRDAMAFLHGLHV